MDNGEYTVTSTDEADGTRRMEYEMKFDIDTWVKEFAIPTGIDDKFIDFIKTHGSEVVTTETRHDVNGNKLKRSNIRIWTKYFRILAGVEKWEENLELIISLAGTNFPDEHITLFVAYLKKLFENVPTNESVMDLRRNMKQISSEIEKAILRPHGGGVRAEIASLFYNRLLTHVLINEATMTDKHVGRYKDIIGHGIDSGCLLPDLLLLVLTKLTAVDRIAVEVIDDKVRNVFEDETLELTIPTAEEVVGAETTASTTPSEEEEG